MNSTYLSEYISLFSHVLSYGYTTKYSLNALERGISYSNFFQKIEVDHLSFPIYVSEIELLKEIYKTNNIDVNNLTTFNECIWAAESYLKIQYSTGLTFEAIFIYLPIEMMYQYYDIYHEMDFSQIINKFNRIYLSQSIFNVLIKKYHYSLKDISHELNISYETLKALKNRKRDIKKLDVSITHKLALFFNVRIETIAELSTKNILNL